MKFTTGDLFDIIKPGDAMVHGCNCQGVMGSGIAATVRAKYPGAYEAYREFILAKRWMIGDVIPWTDGNITVLNALTQEFYGRDKNTVYVSYDAIAFAFRIIRTMHDNEIVKFDRLIMPKIGAGLANGDWNRIESIIDRELNGANFTWLTIVQ